MEDSLKLIEYYTVCPPKEMMSQLLYDNDNSPIEQAGFLVGKMFLTRDSIQYSEMNIGPIERHHCIEIKEFTPHPELHLYNCNYDKDIIPKDNLIVGWFTLRELITTNSTASMKLTFTEKLIHENLKNLKNLQKLSVFIGCVIEPYKNPDQTISLKSVKFFRTNNENAIREGKEKFEEVPYGPQITTQLYSNAKFYENTKKKELKKMCNDVKYEIKWKEQYNKNSKLIAKMDKKKKLTNSKRNEDQRNEELASRVLVPGVQNHPSCITALLQKRLYPGDLD